MDNPTSNAVTEVKYQKLASEYAKLRAQASVLKKAVLDEQAKYAALREQLRQREATVRRTEQEVDSLGFRNKLLEQRVAALQLELTRSDDVGKRSKTFKRFGGSSSGLLGGSSSSFSGKGDSLHHQSKHLSESHSDLSQDTLIFEELQKKIIENAQLTSLIDDKSRDVVLYTERITNLEKSLEKRCAEQNEIEKRLRKELESLQNKNAELENKLVEAASILGSEDALSVASDFTPMHHSHNYSTSSLAQSSDARIANLEKEILHWRTQFELAKLHEQNKKENSNNDDKDNAQNQASCDTSTAAAGITVKSHGAENKNGQKSRDSFQDPPEPPSKEQIIFNSYSKKYEELLKSKCLAETKVASFETESEHLQNCLESATLDLKNKDKQIDSLNQALRMLEEDLTTTRVNYEEQISVLTEQVISLSDQLAACK